LQRIAPQSNVKQRPRHKTMTKQDFAILFIFGAAVIVAALNIDAFMVM
jgi:hypothetical protein